MTNTDLVYLFTLFVATFAAVYFVWKELFAIMFSRKLAQADGINTKPFVYLIIFLAGVVITFSLKLVGGLLIYALIFNPASTVLQFSENMRKVVIASPMVGMVTTVSGLVASLFFDLPVGSCIVIVSTIVFAFALLLSPKRRRKDETSK
jgi:ABC-type Mn2+/Zn2+ transport system permease subunit